MPSADDVAALARSSPWRWTTLRFTVVWPRDPWRTTPVRAWLRRPDRLRVETVDDPMDDALFATRGSWLRGARRSGASGTPGQLAGSAAADPAVRGAGTTEPAAFSSACRAAVRWSAP